MLSKIWIVSALSAVTLAVPTLPFSATAAQPPADMTILADYFKLLGSKIQNLKSMSSAPVCDFTKASMQVACKYYSIKHSKQALTYFLQHPHLSRLSAWVLN